jgi:predicted RNA-binding protein associated with RNAse of E/G family
MRPGTTIVIDYLRPPDRRACYVQRVLAANQRRVVTLQEGTPLPHALRVDGRVVLEPGSPAVWFTYPGRWYDVGRFFRRDGTPTGVYANAITPVERTPQGWRTVDLFLDLWVGDDGTVRLLDEDEFAAARAAGWIDAAAAQRAERTLRRLAGLARAGRWPPREVRAWRLDPISP